MPTFGRRYRSAFALVVATLALLTLASPASATYPGRNGLIAFAYNTGDGTTDIYTLAAHGSPTRLTHVDDAWAPAWSPDGSLIAFDTGGGISVVTSKGQPVRRLVTLGSQPTWSPSMKQIAYVVGRSLYVVPATGGVPTRITVSPRGCSDTGPRWSPIAASVVFLRTCRTGAAHRIMLVDVTRTTTRLVTADGAINRRDVVGSPDFLPSGRRISFTAQCATASRCIAGNNVIVTTTLTGGQRQAVTHDPTCNNETSDCYPYTDVHATPDGRDFVFTVGTNGGDCVIELHGSPGWCSDADVADVQPVNR
jgi:Tol biopolymer transport system component